MDYLVFINVLASVTCLFDKYLAKRKKYRISEKILLSMCAIGGVYGFYIVSRIIRHKTRDKKFLIFLYPILIIWLILGFIMIGWGDI